MPQANSILTGFNSGEFSPLMFGRVDFRRYGFALKTGTGFFSTPQGAALATPGTSKFGLARDQDAAAKLTPWIFSDQQVLMLEWSDLKLRFYDNTGVLLEKTWSVTAVVVTATGLDLTVTGHSMVTGEYIYLAGFEASKNVNARTYQITVVDANTLRIVVTPPTTIGSLTTATVARVYEVTSPYAAADVHAIRLVRSLDVTYVYCGEKAGSLIGYPVYKLTRFGTTNWTLAQVEFTDGPYLASVLGSTTIAHDVTGSPIAKMTSNTLPAGYVASGSTESVGNEYYRAFDQDPETYWAGTVNQKGVLQVLKPSVVAVTGYAIHVSVESADATYTAVDHAPSTWTLQGSNDGSTWTDLDRQMDFVAYDKGRTPFISIGNTATYDYYRIDIEKCVRNGPIVPWVSHLNLGVADASVRLTAVSVTGINANTGFQTTDIGRLIRVRGNDLNWRALRITARPSTLIIDADLEGEPFVDLKPALEFRLGIFSDTTGHPVHGVRFKSRQLMGGVKELSSFIVGSEANSLERMLPSDPDGIVTDENGFALELDSPELADVRWFAPFDKDRGILIGTGTGLHVITRTDASKPFSGTNLDNDPAEGTWASREAAIHVKQAVLFLSIDSQRLHEVTHSFTEDGFLVRDLSLFANHMAGEFTFDQPVYVSDPYPLVLLRCTNGELMIIAYERSEDVLGWFRYPPGSGAEIESVAVLPDPVSGQKLPWLQVKRTYGGQTWRTIERMDKFWRPGFTTADTGYVQSAIRYSGAATTTFYGLSEYEGATLVGLADGAPITPFVVVNGTHTLPEAASEVVFGLGFDADCETVSLEAGAAQGTAQGQSKRVHEVSVLLLESQTGQLGKRVDGALRYEDIEYRKSTDPLGVMPPPFTGFKQVEGLSGHDIEATVAWKREADKPLPLNVVALVPGLETRG